MDPARAPIFVIGTGRSGTTLLRFMLCAHPRIYITHEASFYLFEKLYPRRAPRRAFLDYYFQTDSYRWLRLAPARVTDGLPDPLERVADAYTAIMREKAAQYGRVRWGDKTPSHAEHLRRIFEDYPDARVIHIVRDPRGVALSLSRMPWASPSVFANAFLFCERERRQVRPFRDRVLQIRLEDLLAEPRATMARVLDHVGEPWDDAVLDHPRHIPDPGDMPPLPWLESAARARGAVVSWREALTPLEIRMVERQARKVMREHGYTRAELDGAPGALAVFWAGVREYPRVVHAIGVATRLVRMLKDPRNFNSAEMRAVGRTLNPGAWAHYPGFVFPDPPAWPELTAG